MYHKKAFVINLTRPYLGQCDFMRRLKLFPKKGSLLQLLFWKLSESTKNKNKKLLLFDDDGTNSHIKTPDVNLWSHTHQIQIATVADRAALVEGSLTQRVVTYETVDKTIVKNSNLQQQLLLEYKRNSKLKSQEYSKSIETKRL